MTGRKRLLSVLVLIVLARADLANAQSSANPLNFDFLDGYLELGIRGRNDRRTRPAADTDLSKGQLKLDEILHLETAGSVWYARLLRFRASMDVHFVQSLSGGDNLFLPGGDLHLNFLEKKPYGFSLFGRVVENEIEETFGRSFKNRLTTYGGGLRFLLGPLPFRLRYTHRFQERTGETFFDLDEETDEIEFMGNYRLREGSDGDIRYVFTDQTLRDQPITRHDFRANNVTYFDPEKRKKFTGIARYYDWSGRTDSSEASVFGTYDWRHTDRLASAYHFDFAHRTFDDRSSNTYSLHASLSHQLYSSLASSASIYANLQNTSVGDIGEYGLRVVERYTKRLGRWGNLGIGLAPYVRLEQQRPDGDSAFVLDQSVTFSLIDDRARLSRRDIEVASIVVTSTDGAITYDPGAAFDYEIQEIDGQIELMRSFASTIPAGGRVSVDYSFRPRAESDVASYGMGGDLQWSYRDWGTLFASVATEREQLLSGRTDRRFNDRDLQEFGFRSRRRWFSALVSFDWEKYDQRASSGNLQTVSLSSPWPGRWRGSVSVKHRGRKFTKPDEKLESWNVIGRFHVQIGRNGLIELDPEYSNEKWRPSDGRDLELLGGTGALRWSFRAVEFRGSVSVHYIKRPGLKGLNNRFFFWVRRYF